MNGAVSKKELPFLVVALISFFLIPYLPTWLLALTDHFIVRIALLAGIVAAAQISPLVAVAHFIVLALLFIERNKAKMKQLQLAMQQSTPESPAIASIVTPDTAPPQPPFETPRTDSVPFAPQHDSGDDSFAPVAESINAKIPLPTEGSNDGSEKAIHQLYEWVNPNLAQEGP